MPKISGECVICKKIIYRWPSQKIKYCSIACRNIGFNDVGNPFYGKNHTETTKKHLREVERDYSVYRTDEYRRKQGKASKARGSGGRQYYKVWVEKYGKEVADKKDDDRKRKLGLSMRGKGNPMYGKPTPKGAGNGWCGWYKGWFFRSILELSYMINVIEKNNYSWYSAEKKDLRIPYINWDGTTRTYAADFIINDNTMVEIKPKRLIKGSILVKTKAQAAKKFCKSKGLKYLLTDCIKLTDDEISNLIKEKKIKFTSKYQQKLEDRINGKINCNSRL